MLTNQERIKLDQIDATFSRRIESVTKLFAEWRAEAAAVAPDLKKVAQLEKRLYSEATLLSQSATEVSWWCRDVSAYLPRRAA